MIKKRDNKITIDNNYQILLHPFYLTTGESVLVIFRSWISGIDARWGIIVREMSDFSGLIVAARWTLSVMSV